MKGKFMQAMVAFLITIGLLPGLATDGETAAKRYLSLGTGNAGGTYYFIGAGFANLFNKYVPDVRVIAESTAGTEENFNYLLRKKIHMGTIGISVIDTALERKTDISEARLMCIGATSDRHWFVRKDSPIRTVSDFRGRKIAVGSPGSGTLKVTKERLLACCGLTFEDIKPAYLSFNETITAIKDGTIDVGAISASLPVASLVDLARQIPLRLIQESEEELKRIFTKYPFFVRVVIPAGTYSGIDTDTITTGSPTAVFCTKELSEDLVYKLMKALYDHPQEKYAIHPQAKQWNLENIYRGGDWATKYVPFHPGAIKYLKEKGVWRGKS